MNADYISNKKISELSTVIFKKKSFQKKEQKELEKLLKRKLEKQEIEMIDFLSKLKRIKHIPSPACPDDYICGYSAEGIDIDIILLRYLYMMKISPVTQRVAEFEFGLELERITEDVDTTYTYGTNCKKCKLFIKQIKML